jgi:hypothetical protein
VPQIAERPIERVGWRGAYVSLGLLTFAIAFPPLGYPLVRVFQALKRQLRHWRRQSLDKHSYAWASPISVPRQGATVPRRHGVCRALPTGSMLEFPEECINRHFSHGRPIRPRLAT